MSISMAKGYNGLNYIFSLMAHVILLIPHLSYDSIPHLNVDGFKESFFLIILKWVLYISVPFIHQL